MNRVAELKAEIKKVEDDSKSGSLHVSFDDFDDLSQMKQTPKKRMSVMLKRIRDAKASEHINTYRAPDEDGEQILAKSSKYHSRNKSEVLNQQVNGGNKTVLSGIWGAVTSVVQTEKGPLTVELNRYKQELID